MGLPARPTVTGNLIACVNRANDTLHGHPDGGTWAAVNGAVSVSSGGVMTAVAAGLDTVLYGVANSCGTTYDSVGVQVPDKHDCDSILATDVITTDEGFVLYPNPTTGIFTVVVPDARLFGDASFVITDMTGKELYVLHTHNLTERATRLDISHYPRGSYMVKVEAEGAVYRQQVVVW